MHLGCIILPSFVANQFPTRVVARSDPVSRSRERRTASLLAPAKRLKHETAPREGDGLIQAEWVAEEVVTSDIDRALPGQAGELIIHIQTTERRTEGDRYVVSMMKTKPYYLSECNREVRLLPFLP